MWEVDKNSSNSQYKEHLLLVGVRWVPSTSMCSTFRSVDCEHKTVVLERPMDPCLLSEADVGVPVDVFCKI